MFTEVDFLRKSRLLRKSLNHSSLLMDITSPYGSHFQLRKSTITITEVTPTKVTTTTEVSFNYGSRLSCQSHKSHLRKSPQLQKSILITEVHFRNLILSTEVHFHHFMGYGSRLPGLNHLRKSTSDLWFTSHSHGKKCLYAWQTLQQQHKK